jgi:phytoene dehydrogenase-like protein
LFTKTAAEIGYDGLALTLRPTDIGTHASGWTITGEVHEDYYEWVNEFEAVHPELGRVWGDFEKEVHADSEAAFEHFYENHKPQSWDYGDI